MVVCDSCRRVITEDDSQVKVSFKYIPGGWIKAITPGDDIVLCLDCHKAVMSFIRFRVQKEENR